MMEAVLSIIGVKLLKDDQKKTINDLFKTMDTSGDGSLGSKEILTVFNKLMINDSHPEEWKETEIEEIINNVDCD